MSKPTIIVKNEKISVVSRGIQGPAGPAGPEGATGPQGPPGSTDANDIVNFAETVRATTLEGLAGGSNQAIAATDSVLSGLAKLQAQIDTRITSASYVANAIPYASGPTTVSPSGLAYEVATKSLILPSSAGVTNGKIRLLGSDLAINAPILAYSTGYAPPSAFYSLAYSSVTASGGFIPSGAFFNRLELSGYSSGNFVTAFTSYLYGINGCNLTGELVGAQFVAGMGNNAAATIASAIGVDGRVLFQNTMTWAIGVRAIARAALGGGSGNVTNAVALAAQITQFSTNTTNLTNGFGVYLAGWNKSASAVWTNTYGIYADTSIDIGSGSKWFIYSLSASKSRLSGGLDLVLGNANHNGLAVTLASGQAVDALAVNTNAGVDAFVVDKNGTPAIKVNAAPADGDIDSNQLFWWFDATNGAAKAKFKGKSANGTVVSGEVALT